MSSLIVDERDQRFVLNEMLKVEELCQSQRYADFAPDMFDMILSEAQKFAEGVVFPTLAESDKVGCRLENGQVYVPQCFHKPYRLFCEGGWNAMGVPPEHGGQGLPEIIKTAAHEWFAHNFAFMSYPGLGEGAAHLVETYGTPEQLRKYHPQMVSGEWGGTMCLTEPGAGSDVGNLSTKAIRQPDGTFRIQGTKSFITAGDNDITPNVIHPVLARIEGDPPGTKGISIFLVPKYLVNDDGTLGARNDFEIAGIEEKMGIHGSSTCLINFGDNGACYAELLGQEREGMKVMFQLMNEARILVGMQGLGSASIAYLHAVSYAKERLQGSSLMDFKDPQAPRVPIIQHPDVRRMLLWMKSNVEGMRALMYYAALAVDRERTAAGEEEQDKWQGILEVLTPICKAYCSDVAFRVCENAVQVYGGYGFCAEYPVEQFLRDEKIASIYEGANGIQALDLVGRKLAMKKGRYFMNLLGEMNATVAACTGQPSLKDLAGKVQQRIDSLAELALYFGQCGREGKFLVPLTNAYPFLMLMGKVVCAWLLLWQARVAQENLEKTSQGKELDAEFIRENREAAFYAGKLASAKYFINHVLPEADAACTAIKSEDLSVMEIALESFAS